MKIEDNNPVVTAPVVQAGLRPYERAGSTGGRLAGIPLVVFFTILAIPFAKGQETALWVSMAISLTGMVSFGVIPWQHIPRWVETVPALVTLVGSNLLVTATGGLAGGFDFILFAPAMWFALYGNRRDIAAAFFIQSLLLFLPVMQTISPGLPPVPPWQHSLVVSMLGAVIVTLIHQLVTQNLRDIAQIERQRNAIDLSQQAMSHDLRGPLGMAKSFTQEVIDSQENPDSRLEMVSKLLASSMGLVTDVMMLHRAYRPSDREPVQLGKLVESSAAAVKGITVQTEVEDTAILIHRSVMARAMSNLFSNAAQHAHGDDPTRKPTIHVRQVRDKDNCVITVEDDGPGIPDDELPMIFEAHERGLHSEGHGLGLAIVRACARVHNGYVEAANVKNGGARFSIIIPIARDNDDS